MCVCVQDVLVNNYAHISKTIGDLTPPMLSLASPEDAARASPEDASPPSPPAAAVHKSPASTPPRVVPVVDAASVQKPPRRRLNISERLGWVDPDGSDADAADAAEADAAEADDDDTDAEEDSDDGAGAADDDDSALVKLFKDPNFTTTQVTVGAKTNTTDLCLRWKFDGPIVFATAPLVKDDKYTVSPSPILVPGGATGSIYVTFDAEATPANKELLKNVTCRWIRQR